MIRYRKILRHFEELGMDVGIRSDRDRGGRLPAVATRDMGALLAVATRDMGALLAGIGVHC